MPYLMTQSITLAFGVIALFFFIVLFSELRRNHKLKDGSKELEQAAKLVLVVHKDEVDYLPFCAVAADQFCLERHTRKIYNDFCKCPEEMQKEIFNQSPFPYPELPYVDWVTDALKKLKKDIVENNLGDDYIGDNFAFFRRAYDCYKELPLMSVDTRVNVFKRIYGTPSFLTVFRELDEQKFSDYLAEYLYYLDGKTEDKPTFDPIPPLDYLWCEMDLAHTPEDKVCGWMMEVVLRVSTQLSNRRNDKFSNYESPWLTYAKLETYEDKYFKCLMTLFQAYIRKG